jgi:hypothetical protein
LYDHETQGIGRFQNLVQDDIVDVASARAWDLISVNPQLAQPIPMRAHYLAGATLSLLAWSIENDLPLSPRHMAQYLTAPPGLHFSDATPLENVTSDGIAPASQAGLI